MTAFKRINTAFADRPGRGEVRFSYAEGNNVIHRVDQLKENPDAAFGQFPDMFGYEAVRGRF